MVILGLARQGKSLARYLAERGAQVTVSDLRSAHALAGARQELADLPIEYVLGGHPESLLEAADLLCLSGGVPADLPLAQQARRRGIPLANDSQLFLEACPAPVIGVTGSAGKTTTATLAARMAEEGLRGSGRRVWLGGNIGNPLITEVEAIRPEDLVVLELSSFQLELMTRSPQVALVLNITPNHLDRHRTMEAYAAAKARILDFQGGEDLAVLGRDDPGAWGLRDRVQGRLWAFGRGPATEDGVFLESGRFVLRQEGRQQDLFPAERVRLLGEHNLLNVAAACAAGAAVGVPAEAMEAAVTGFRGVEHRLEFVRRLRGVDWYNDSIATSPERAMAAVRAFDRPLVLLAGGRDKDLPWEAFAEEVGRRVEHLVLFGESAERIARAVAGRKEKGVLKTVEVHPDLRSAVQAAARLARTGHVVLLAPGGTSFDEFRDFAERGERFKEWVRGL